MSSPFGVCSPCGHPFHQHCWHEMIANGSTSKCPMCNTNVERFVRVFMNVCDSNATAMNLSSNGNEVVQLHNDCSKCCRHLENHVVEMKEEIHALQSLLRRFYEEALSQLSSDELCNSSNEEICMLQERLRRFHEEALSQLEGDWVSFW
eukprot:scaffold23406_cov142-Skeletonema_menzelii.AAC.3